MNRELFICLCENIEHQLVFTYCEDELEEKDVYVSVYLCPERNIWKRITNGIKYIFGYRSIYGDFDEFIFKKEDVHKLEKVIKYLKG